MHPVQWRLLDMHEKTLLLQLNSQFHRQKEEETVQSMGMRRGITSFPTGCLNRFKSELAGEERNVSRVL